MNRYTIYCTPEQTKLAYRLGAPVESTKIEEPKIKELVPIINCVCVDKQEQIYAKFPTTEQMSGWIREQGYMFDSALCIKGYECILYSTEDIFDCLADAYDDEYDKAVLKIIDKALDYLWDKKYN